MRVLSSGWETCLSGWRRRCKSSTLINFVLRDYGSQSCFEVHPIASYQATMCCAMSPCLFLPRSSPLPNMFTLLCLFEDLTVVKHTYKHLVGSVHGLRVNLQGANKDIPHHSTQIHKSMDKAQEDSQRYPKIISVNPKSPLRPRRWHLHLCTVLADFVDRLLKFQLQTCTRSVEVERKHKHKHAHMWARKSRERFIWLKLNEINDLLICSQT